MPSQCSDALAEPVKKHLRRKSTLWNRASKSGSGNRRAPAPSDPSGLIQNIGTAPCLLLVPRPRESQSRPIDLEVRSAAAGIAQHIRDYTWRSLESCARFPSSLYGENIPSMGRTSQPKGVIIGDRKTYVPVVHSLKNAHFFGPAQDGHHL